MFLSVDLSSIFPFYMLPKLPHGHAPVPPPLHPTYS